MEMNETLGRFNKITRPKSKILLHKTVTQCWVVLDTRQNQSEAKITQETDKKLRFIPNSNPSGFSQQRERINDRVLSRNAQ